MKFLIVFASVIFAAQALDKEVIAEMKGHLVEKINTCAAETKASPDDVASIISHKIPDSHEGKCIFFCMHKVFNAQNADGSLNMPGALDTLDMLKDLDMDLHGKLVSIFKGCESTPTDADPCIYATSIVKCVVTAGKAMGLDELLVQ